MNLYTSQKAPENIKLFNNLSERKILDQQAELFSIINAVETLEKAFVKDLVSREEYTAMCTDLITKYKTVLNILGASFSIDAFFGEFSPSLHASHKRLVSSGVPATVENAAVLSGPGGNSAATHTLYVAKAVESFITTMDLLSLNILTVDQLHPPISALLDALNRLPFLPPNFEGKNNVCKWLICLNAKSAPTDELTPEEKNRCYFDLNKGLQAFMSLLNPK